MFWQAVEGDPRLPLPAVQLAPASCNYGIDEIQRANSFLLFWSSSALRVDFKWILVAWGTIPSSKIVQPPKTHI